MKSLGNLLWFLFGGLAGGIAWIVAGLACCITVIGIPLGLQCFKFASLAFFPFRKEVVYGGGTASCLANIIWLIFCGFWMAVGYVLIGALWCVTIVGIPFGKQCFKLARLAFYPFGAQVVEVY